MSIHPSVFLTPELIEGCFNLIKPALTAELITKVPGRVAAYVCFLNPMPPDHLNYHSELFWSGILGEHNETLWKHPVDQYARAKAEAAWRMKLSNHIAYVQCPHLFEGCDFKYIGGAYHNGYAVGTSGLATEEDDLMVSNMLIAMVEAQVLKAMNKKRVQKILFLRDEPSNKV